MKRIPINPGDRFGRLTVLQVGEKRVTPSGSVAACRCKCDCGKEAVIPNKHLKRGDTRSCGCLQLEATAQKAKMRATHGQRGSRLYKIWTGMKSRASCTNPNRPSFKNYSSQGVVVCEEWQSFEGFMAWAQSSGYDDSLTIDRIKSEGDYCPDNCRWATYATQARNKRTNLVVDAFGESKCLADWADDPRCMVNAKTLRMRLVRMKMHPEAAITTPLMRKRDQLP